MAPKMAPMPDGKYFLLLVLISSHSLFGGYFAATRPEGAGWRFFSWHGIRWKNRDSDDSNSGSCTGKRSLKGISAGKRIHRECHGHLVDEQRRRHNNCNEDFHGSHK
jgi:hypothetical protein